MKKVLILLSATLLSGCFICHKQAPKQDLVETQEVVEIVEYVPVQEVKVISRYSMSEAANFAFDSEEIRADKNKLGELFRDIEAHPEALIVVEGYTDNVGTEEYNKELSYKRAMTVAKAIAQHGYPNDIQVRAMGSANPIASNATEAGRAQNRRVDVVLIQE